MRARFVSDLAAIGIHVTVTTVIGAFALVEVVLVGIMLVVSDVGRSQASFIFFPPTAIILVSDVSAERFDGSGRRF